MISTPNHNGLRLFVTSLVVLASIGLIAFSDHFSTLAQRFDRLRDRTPELQTAPAAGTITGRAFVDFNSNGSYDTASGLNSIDTGISGVAVSAYDSTGTLRGTATAIADGTYSLAATGTGPYRVEFTAIPTGFSTSARSTDSVTGGSTSNSGSTVQFIDDGVTSNVNLAVNRPEEYCQNNPTLIVPRYAQGSSNGPYAANLTFYDFPYNAGTAYTDTTIGNYDSPTAHTLTTAVSSIGTVNSLAYDESSGRLYAAAYFKRHAGFGPGADNVLNNADDAGAIYLVNPANSAVTQTFTVPNATTNDHDTANYGDDNLDTGWNAVGKTSLGGMDLADDNSRLFVMNLQDRRLYALNPTTGALLGSSVSVTTLTLPTPGGTGANCPTASTNTNKRPFAVEFHRGSVYIGVVCTAQTSGNVTDLFAYVFQVDPTTLVINATPVFSAPLNYGRGVADPGQAAEWQPWTTNIQANFAYPQPMLTDIEFENGNLILGVKDRSGDTSLDAGPNSKRTAGDTLRACGTFGSWTLESNGRCGGTGSAPQNTGQGPGNGEFYHNDDFCSAPNNGNFHDEVSWGALLYVPGRQHVVTALLDPISRIISSGATFDGGFRYLNNNTGNADRAYRLYNGSGGVGQPDFGKANGIGSIAALCSAAPIEIGNRVWRDLNQNGVQDPGETPLAGVTVRLYQGSTLVGTAVTDANGEYYFVSSSAVDPNTADNLGQVNGGIQPSTGYQVRLDNAADYLSSGPLFGLLLTSADQTAQAGDDDASDSDASPAIDPAGSPAGTYPVVAFTTGAAGSNSHRFDFGFVAVPSAAPANVSGRVTTASGTGIRNARVVLVEADGTRHMAATGTFGYYRFNGISVGQTVFVDVSVRRFTFSVPTRTVNLNENFSDLNFVADQW